MHIPKIIQKFERTLALKRNAQNKDLSEMDRRSLHLEYDSIREFNRRLRNTSDLETQQALIGMTQDIRTMIKIRKHAVNARLDRKV